MRSITEKLDSIIKVLENNNGTLSANLLEMARMWLATATKVTVPDIQLTIDWTLEDHAEQLKQYLQHLSRELDISNILHNVQYNRYTTLAAERIREAIIFLPETMETVNNTPADNIPKNWVAPLKGKGKQSK